LWNEIILKRFYFNKKKLVKEYTDDLELSDVLNFFDSMVDKNLKKLSVQEFSKKVKKLPSHVSKIRNYQSILLNDINDIRNREKYLNLQ